MERPEAVTPEEFKIAFAIRLAAGLEPDQQHRSW
jgi:hypothetical protein